MLNKCKEDYEKIINSKKFNKKLFLVNLFLMCPPKDIKNLKFQLDFYNPEKDTLTSYIVNGNIRETENEKIFKEDKQELEELTLEEIKFDFDNTIKICNEILKKYHETPDKIIILLQKIKTPVWNISYITGTFNLINIKIDAISGEIMEENKSSLLSFKKE